MGFTRIDNVGVGVKDIKRAAAFYRSFGCTVDERESDATVRIGNIHLWMFQTGSEFSGNRGRSAEFFTNPAGLDHLSFETDNFEATVRDLDQRGVPWIGGMVGQPGEFRYRGFRDPDGNCLYVIEHPPAG